MPKVRIHQIAKELGITSKEVVEQSVKLGMKVTSHQNVVSETDAERIKKALISVPEENSSETAEKQKETVKVFKSETGDFVERRSGSRVIRRRKKVVKPEPEPVEAEAVPAAGEPAEIKPEPEIPVPSEPAEAEAAQVPSAESEAIPEEAPEAEVEVPQGDDLELKPEPSPEPGKVIKEVEDEEKPKQKKKAKKSKPLKEEIHDEETLEQLKRAFRTKVPSRKEYVIQNKKPKLRQNFDGLREKQGSLPGRWTGRESCSDFPRPHIEKKHQGRRNDSGFRTCEDDERKSGGSR